jgi:hypothetical protein
MVKIILLTSSKINGSNFKRGDILTVTNNIAHGLIDAGNAKIYRQVLNRNTKEMVSPESGEKGNFKPKKSTYNTK